MSSEAQLPPPAVLTLADFTSPGLIIPQLRGEESASVIKELSQVLQAEKRVGDLLPFYQAALNREFMLSTEMEAGIAFPHARVAGSKQLSVALGRSAAPLSWGPNTGRSVRLVFLMAVPATDATQYLSLISGLARLAKDAALVAKLHAARDAAELFAVLQQVALRTNSPANAGGKSAL
jgi:mannitol/fructose-specific phosphotransferase system IIA component (Ntr-type)